MKLNKAEINHLRRLLGWMRCEVGQSPEEQRATMASIAHALTEYPDEAAQGRIMESYDRAASIPKYVRAGLKALTKHLREYERQMENGAVVMQSAVQTYRPRRNVLQPALQAPRAAECTCEWAEDRFPSAKEEQTRICDDCGLKIIV